MKTIDLKHLDTDIISAGVKDENMRLAFTVLAKHVNAALTTENTNDATGGSESLPTELDRELVKNLAGAALRDLEDHQAPQSVRNAVAILVELVRGRAVLR